MNSKVTSFYDGFAEQQVRTGVNLRHRRIMDWLRTFGLRDGMQVLEIGCGVGTQTFLLAEAIPNGTLLANDISPVSVERARERLAGRKNVEFVVGDIVELGVTGTFDMIVLPDVLEHIPLADHGQLLLQLAKLLKADGKIVIHIPSPQLLEFETAHHPEVLQVIDQPLHLHILLPHVAAAGLYLHAAQHYGLWTDEGPDAAVFVLKHYRNDVRFNLTPPPVGIIGQWRRRIARLRGRN